MSEWAKERLVELLEDSMDDIKVDYGNDTWDAWRLEESSIDTADGIVFGTFKYLILPREEVVTIKASGIYQGFTDPYSYASESHYTKDIEFDDLEDFEYEIVEIRPLSVAIDRSVEADQEANRE